MTTSARGSIFSRFQSRTRTGNTNMAPGQEGGAAAKFEEEDSLLKTAIQTFELKFGCSPDVAACAPGRVNLIGEHTDYNDGFVFPMALPMVTIVVGSKTSSGECRVLTQATGVDDPTYIEFSAPGPGKPPLEPGLPRWANYVKGVVACYLGTAPSFDAVIVTSVPLGGGLSSSASLEVAMYTFLECVDKEAPQKVSQKEKALACQKAEHTFAGMPCGIMDQFISVMGQAGHALLLDCRAMEGELVPLQDPEVVVLITNSNVKHELSSSEYPLRRQQCEGVAKTLGVAKLREASMQQLQAIESSVDSVAYRRARHVIGEIERCQVAASALKSSNYSQFGTLMVQSHNALRDDFEVSCPELDQLVEAAMEVEGVYGSRMTGGGFGGCTVTLVKKDAVDRVIDHIKDKYSGRPTFYICSAACGARQLDM